jgi:hypothetical protein
MRFEDLELNKEKLRRRISEQETAIRGSVRSIVAAFTFRSLRNQITDAVLRNPELVIRTGYMIFSLLTRKRSRRKK